MKSIVDLFVYEWRKRSSDKRMNPAKPVRTSYRRIRERLDADGRVHLHHSDKGAVMDIIKKSGRDRSFLTAMWEYPSTLD